MLNSVKPIIYVFSGPPLSGKSTISKKLCKALFNLGRVCKDDLRYMFKNRGILSEKLEKMVHKDIFRLTDNILDEGLNVIIDNTHCKKKYIDEIINNYSDTCDIVLVAFYEPLWKLYYRNIKRKILKGIYIPRVIIKNMYNNQIKMMSEIANEKYNWITPKYLERDLLN